MYWLAVLLWIAVVYVPVPWSPSALPIPPGKLDCVGTDPDVLFQVLGPAFNYRYMSVKKPADFHRKIPGLQSLPSFHVKDQNVSAPVVENWQMMSDQQVGPNPRSFYVNADFERPIQDEDVPGLSLLVSPSELNMRSRRSPAPSDDVKKPSPHVRSGPYSTKNEVASDGVASDGVASDGVASDRMAKLWGCNSTVIWLDLGKDHFPRYLRGVECSKSSCWFGIFSCQPRAFTVNVLRRKVNSCGTSAQQEEEEDNEVSKLTRVISSLAGVPHQLTERWQFVEVAVTFCCDCVQDMVHNR